MTTLAWKVNRLRLMSLPEVVWRLRQSVSSRARRVGIGRARVPPAVDISGIGQPFVHPQPPGIDRASVIRSADALLLGKWTPFGHEPLRLGFPPDWNTDPCTGTRVPLAFGERIEYRDERVVGDIKYVWELGRHLELVTLAQAWQTTKSEKYSAGSRVLLESWLDACPYLRGVHWASSLELAVRLVNWSVAWQLLGGLDAPMFADADGTAFRDRWLRSVYQHAHYIRTHLSAYSSAANHLFGELTGLFIAGTTWPCWPEMVAWRNDARKGLEREALAQNSADGVNLEQALCYQREVMEMMLLCVLAARAQGQDFSTAFAERLERLAEFVAAVMDVGGHVPMSGDADDGIMLRLSSDPYWDPYRSLLASCSLLFARGDLKHKASVLDDKTRWLFGGSVETRWAALPTRSSLPRLSFPGGGQFLLGAEFDTPREVRLVIDCAPIGYLSIAAHGHADALAFTVSAGGYELLIDPGTYAYHTKKAWRDYFRGTLAHNTVRVDGQDQSVSGGTFMWLHKAQARLVRHEPHGEPQEFVGEHDGYMRLPDPVLHRRHVRYDSGSGEVLVTDRIECRSAHEIEVAWHWPETAEVCLDGSGVIGTNGPATARICCDAPGFCVELRRGEASPIAGWVSRNYDRKEPTFTSLWRGHIEQSTEIVTRIQVSPGAQTAVPGA